MSRSLELLARGAVVVDLPVEDDPDRAVLVRHRLLSGAQVDDAEATMGECRACIAVQAGFVRPAMSDHIAHADRACRRILIESIACDDSGDSTHFLYLFFISRGAP